MHEQLDSKWTKRLFHTELYFFSCVHTFIWCFQVFPQIYETCTLTYFMPQIGWVVDILCRSMKLLQEVSGDFVVTIDQLMVVFFHKNVFNLGGNLKFRSKVWLHYLNNPVWHQSFCMQDLCSAKTRPFVYFEYPGNSFTSKQY